MVSKMFTAILYTDGDLTQVTLDRETPSVLAEEITKVLDAGRIQKVASPFTAPFVALIDDDGPYHHAATALVVTPDSPTGVDALFGKALFVRQRLGTWTSVKPGDLKIIHDLPWWIRRGPSIEAPSPPPSAAQYEAAGGQWEPQIHLMLTDALKRQQTFANVTLAKFQETLVSYHVRRIGPLATSFELMVKPEALKDLRAFIGSAFDRNGRLKRPW